MPFKRSRVPKYLILEDTNPAPNRWGFAIGLLLLILILAAGVAFI